MLLFIKYLANARHLDRVSLFLLTIVKELVKLNPNVYRVKWRLRSVGLLIKVTDLTGIRTMAWILPPVQGLLTQ